MIDIKTRDINMVNCILDKSNSNNSNHLSQDLDEIRFLYKLGIQNTKTLHMSPLEEAHQLQLEACRSPPETSSYHSLCCDAKYLPREE